MRKFLIGTLLWSVLLRWSGVCQEAYPKYAEAMKDPEVVEIYKIASSKGWLIKTEMGEVTYPAIDPKDQPVHYTVLWVWIRSDVVSKRIIYARTQRGLKMLLILIPKNQIDNALIQLLKK
jgi:hypothetical protein